MKKNKAVFLDRDGTININHGYIYKIKDFKFIKGVIEAIKLLNKNNYKIIVITNQSGIARGYFKEKNVKNLHKFVNKELKKNNAKIDRFYYCPHHPNSKITKYKKICNCRKPGTGLLLKAVKKYNIDIEKSYFIGDKIIDIKAGKMIGCKTILLNNEKKSKNNYKGQIELNLYNAILKILSDDEKEIH